MVRRKQQQASFSHSRSCLRLSSKACAQVCMHTCDVKKVRHAEYADEHTISQIHASKVDESTLTKYSTKHHYKKTRTPHLLNNID